MLVEKETCSVIWIPYSYIRILVRSYRIEGRSSAFHSRAMPDGSKLVRAYRIQDRSSVILDLHASDCGHDRKILIR